MQASPDMFINTRFLVGPQIYFELTRLQRREFIHLRYDRRRTA